MQNKQGSIFFLLVVVALSTAASHVLHFVQQVLSNTVKAHCYINSYSVEGLIELFCCSKGIQPVWKTFQSRGWLNSLATAKKLN